MQRTNRDQEFSYRYDYTLECYCKKTTEMYFNAYHLERLPVFVVKYVAKSQASVVQRLDNTIQWISRYPADKCSQNKPRYPLDSDLASE